MLFKSFFLFIFLLNAHKSYSQNFNIYRIISENVSVSLKGKLIVNDSTLILTTNQTIQFKYNLLSDTVRNSPMYKFPIVLRIMEDRSNPNYRFKLYSSNLKKNMWYFSMDMKDDFGKVYSTTFVMKKKDD
jgi:hypothetical protein